MRRFTSYDWRSNTVLLSLALFLPLSAAAVDLVALHDVAVQQDAELQAAYYRMRSGNKLTNIAWANYYPQISGRFTHSYGNNESSLNRDRQADADIDTRTYNLNLTQSIFNWRNLGELQQAEARTDAADADYQAAYKSFLLRVSERYFGVLQAQDDLVFAQAEEKALQRQFEQAEQRFEVGLTAVTDVLDARARYDQARARTIVAQNTLDDAYEGLSQLTGESFESLDLLQDDLPLETPVPDNTDDWIDIAMVNSPVLSSLRATADAAQANIRIQRSGHMPTLDAVASFNEFTNFEFAPRGDQGDLDSNAPNLLVASRDTRFELQLNVPIFSGGRVTAQRKQARHELNAAYMDVELQERTVMRNTYNFYRSVMADINEVGAREQAVISARSALEATQAGFEVGTRTIVDVLISEQQFFQAQRDHAQARYDYILDHLRLKEAAGVLEAEDLVRINTLLYKEPPGGRPPVDPRVPGAKKSHVNQPGSE
ncbi:MAG: TolC family outer membrane protein [Gammaproteobacteria bacterium]|nr:TolC family outer membrane protein [Gammaproteobacteria bacterium]